MITMHPQWIALLEMTTLLELAERIVGKPEPSGSTFVSTKHNAIDTHKYLHLHALTEVKKKQLRHNSFIWPHLMRFTSIRSCGKKKKKEMKSKRYEMSLDD